MKKFVTAALLTMPLSLFAEGGATGANGTQAAGTTASPQTQQAATEASPAPTPTVMNKVTCVGKTGSELTDDQKKALETAGVKAKTYKSWKSTDVSSVNDCKGPYTIENGTASKVMKKAHTAASKK